MDTSELHALGYRKTEEVTKLIGLKNPATLRNWRSLMKGPPFIKLHGRLIVYKLADVERWMASRTTTPEKEHPTLVQGTRAPRRRAGR